MSPPDNNDGNGVADEESKRIDGKAIAAKVREDVKQHVIEIQERYGVDPGLAVILVGGRRDSQTYVNMKKRACAAANITSVGYDFDDDVSERELLETVDKLNRDDAVHGILVQLPLPKHIDQDRILHAVSPAKDVDGLHPANVASLAVYRNGDALNAPFSIPCTPLGCLVLLDECGVDLAGKHCVVLGRSNLVGLPMSRLLLSRDATVTVLHSKSNDVDSICRMADVIISAVGKPNYVESTWIKEGAVVIDVGINSVDVVPDKPGGKNYKLVGDVDYDNAVRVASRITPVPGGVGPMTIAMLLRNTLHACERAVLEKKGTGEAKS